MGRHTSDASPVERADPPRLRAGSLGPVTDPLLLETVERELARARQEAPGGHRRPASSAAASAAPARHGLVVEDDLPEDAYPVSSDTKPVPAPFGTRIPITFEPWPEEAPGLHDDDPVQPEPATAIVATPVEPEERIRTAPAMRLDTDRDFAEAARIDRAGGTIAFGIVVGTAVIAVLTLVAILPF